METETNSITDRKISNRAVIIFWVTVIIFSAAAEWAYCKIGDMWVALLMWIPALAAFLATYVSMRDSKERSGLAGQRALLGIKTCRSRYIIMGVLIPIVYLIIPYIIYWTTHPGSVDIGGTSVINICIYAIIYLLISTVTAAGEEIGWRGFMLPALTERVGFSKAVTAVGLFWCLWHFPLLIWGGYMEGTPLWYKLCAFVLCIFPVGIIMALLTVKSGSVWPAVFMHSAHNAFDQSIFGAITEGEDKMYFVSETGLLTVLCVWMIAVVMSVLYSKRRNAK